MSQALWGHYEMHTVNQWLDRAVERYGDDQFVDFLGRTQSFREFRSSCDTVAAGLAALGVRKGDTITWVMDNSLEALHLFFGACRIGAINAPLNTAYKGTFLSYQVNDAGSKLIVTDAAYADRVLAVEAELKTAERLLVLGDLPTARPERLRVGSYAELLNAGSEPPVVEVLPSDLATLIYTAGTTGPSKGCMISHNYACNLATQGDEAQKTQRDDVVWTPLPMFHLNIISSTVLAGLRSGNRIAIYTRFSVSNFWPEVRRTGATIASLMGAMTPLLAFAPDNEDMLACRGQLRIGGGAPFPPDLQTIWRERFGVKYTGAYGYGLTECACLTMSAVDDVSPPDASGKRVPEFDVRVVDDEGREVPPGVAGELIVRPLRPHVMFEGYWNKPVETYQLMRGLWFHTGDIGRFDEDGFFYFVDRKKDYMRRRGENISSFELETSFRSHPAIEDVAVHAVLSDKTEDEVKVTCVLKPGSELTAEALCLWSIDNLPFFTVPRYYEFRAELPRNPLGRVMKYTLREEGVTAGTWDRETEGVTFERR